MKHKHLTGQAVLSDPLMNKGLAFTEEERSALGLNGLLPYGVANIEDQVSRRYANFCKLTGDLAKYVFLSSVQNRNEVVFYRLVLEHLEEMMPLIYTPTVGEVSLNFSSLFNSHRGLYVSYPLLNRMEEIIANIPNEHVDVIVATDGERILGLGDLGIGGMAISVGKLSLYTLLGGIHPARTLPVLLDVGTNNPALLEHPQYVGWRHPRIQPAEYQAFMDQFVQAIKKRFPHVLLQWEDFGRGNARPILERYQDEICSFNDDMQGTAAVTLAAILSAIRAQKEKLIDQRIVMVGAGTAGLGICEQIVHAMVRAGASPEEAHRCFYLIDRNGLLQEDSNFSDDNQKVYARKRKEIESWRVADPSHISLLDVVEHAKPTVMIGVSAQPGLFTQEIVKAMAAGTKHPIICPLSNPTSKAEAQPQNIMEWSDGRAIIATGSPFPPVAYGGKVCRITQCNNSYIFPGLGLGVIAVKARKVSNEMFLQAAETLSSYSPLLASPNSSEIFPPLPELRCISRQIAISVAQIARDQGFTAKLTDQEIEALVDRTIWYPDYN